MEITASKLRVKSAGIVLGLYIAALLLAGPLHPLMHDSGREVTVLHNEENRLASVCHDAHIAPYTLHSCPACFLNSHQALAADQPLAEFVTAFSNGESVAVESGFSTRLAFSPISNRAPPFSL